MSRGSPEKSSPMNRLNRRSGGDEKGHYLEEGSGPHTNEP